MEKNYLQDTYDDEPKGSKSDVPQELQEHINNMWKNMYYKQGNSFNDRDFKHYVQKHQFDPNQEDELRTAFSASILDVKTVARRVVEQILFRYGGTNLSDSQILEIAKKFQKKHGFSKHQMMAIYRHVRNFSEKRKTSDIIQSNFHFYKPRSEMANALGYVDFENITNAQFSTSEMEIVNKILKLNELHKPLYMRILHNCLSYQHCAFEKQGIRSFNPRYDKKECAIDPVLVALFCPKIQTLDEVMLMSNFGNIVNARVKNIPIETFPDYELFWYITQGFSDMLCDNDSPATDLLIRFEMQICIWKQVYLIRNGIFYDSDDYETYAKMIELCKYQSNEAPDILIGGDEGDRLNRIMNVFAFRPLLCKTNIYNNFTNTVVNQINPYNNLELWTGDLEEWNMIHIRPSSELVREHFESLKKKDSDKTFEKYEKEVGLYAGIYLPLCMSGRDIIIDPMTRTTFEKKYKVQHSEKDVLIFHVYRRLYDNSHDVKKLFEPWRFDNLPLTNINLHKLNSIMIIPTPVFDKNLDIANPPSGARQLYNNDKWKKFYPYDKTYLDQTKIYIDPNNLNNNYTLTSVVCCKVNTINEINIVENKNVTILFKKIEDTAAPPNAPILFGGAAGTEEALQALSLIHI